jgi:uncharacterized protein (DUF885 family)
MIQFLRLLVCAALLCALQAGPATTNPAPEFAETQSEMRVYIDHYTADHSLLRRYQSIELSQERTERLKRFYTEWLERLPALNFDSFSEDGKIDYLLFRGHLQHELRQLDLAAKNQAEAASLVPFSQAIIDLESARRRMDPVDGKKSAAVLSSLTKQLADRRRSTETTLKTAPPSRTVANRAAGETVTLRAILKHWFDFYNGYDPMFTWWAAESFKSADASLRDYAVFLREQVAGVKGGAADLDSMASIAARRNGAPSGPPSAPGSAAPPANTMSRMDTTEDIIGDPIGRDGLMSELANEMIPYTPEELIDIANKHFAWCEEQMKKASNELGYGDDWKKALEHVKNMYVEPGKQPQAIRDLAREAEAFLDEHDLVTIPPLARETWRMEMMSPERQLVNPFFLGGESIIVSYPTDAMTYEQKLMSMRGNNIPFSRATVFHELIPGHELQGYMADRYHPYRNLFGTPFLVEGWSLYWEMLMWDMHFQKTPEDRIGAMFWRMHRCARIIFSLSFHLGKMTPAECVDFLVGRVGFERANAVGEVRRSFLGTYSPLYQAAYLLGGMQLYSLHKELVDAGKTTNRQFHDAVLKEGRIPVEMIRASLTKQKLSRDFVSNWRFSQ